MRHMKTAVLVLVACSTLLWAIGTEAALGKVCSGAGTGASCGVGHGNVYTGPLKAEGGRFDFGLSNLAVSCSGSALEGEITKGETGAAKVTSMKFGACFASFGAECAVTTTASSSAPWPLAISVSTAPNGTAILEGFTVTMQCGAIACRYSTKIMGASGELVVKGGEKARLQFSQPTISKEEPSNVSCGSLTKIAGEYLITTPSSLYVT